MTSATDLRRTADTGAPYLNLLLPGIGQLYQRRIAPGLYLLVISVVLSWIFLAFPRLHMFTLLASLAVLAWSILDAVRAGQRAAAQLSKARQEAHNTQHTRPHRPSSRPDFFRTARPRSGPILHS